MPVLAQEKDPLPTKAHVTKPGIEINEKGLWKYKGQKIDNPSVLSYFKRQLRRDAKGYYIENAFKDRREHAYLDKVRSFPLQVTTIRSLVQEGKEFYIQALLDSHENLKAQALNLFILGTDKIALILSERGKIPARLSPGAMTSLMSYLHQDARDDYFLVLPSMQYKQKLNFARLEDFLQF